MSKWRKQHKKRKSIYIFMIAIVVLGLGNFVANQAIQVKEYTISLGLEEPVTMVMVTDTHGKWMLHDTGVLFSKIEQCKPDLIVALGDFLAGDAQQQDVETMCCWLTQLQEIAPVYFTYGNQELNYMQTQDGLLDQVAQTGVTVLENDFTEIEVGESRFRLGGMYAYAFPSGMSEEAWQQSERYQFLCALEDTQLPTVMLTHRPDSFIFHEAYRQWDVDLVLCGHTHGGLVRLPFVGGLYVPDQGWLPEYDYGIYELDGLKMVISSGLAGYGWVPRVCNRPEIVCLTLQ